jgi:hypothetical protein
VLEKPRPGFRRSSRRPKRRLGLQIFEIFENLGGVEDLQLTMDQNRHLPLGIDPRDVRMRWRVEPLHIEGHHDALDIKPFLESCNLGLGAEHAQRA